MNTATHIIYAGGTFGSHGTPLSPLPADEFLPILQTQFHAKLPHLSTQILPNHLIKDSSTLTPSDFVHLYGLILQAYADGGRRFVLITGTDSLSFLAAFLANAFADLPEPELSLIITGSMQPLFISDNPIYTINERSDAWANLADSVIATSERTGVFVQFAHKLMDAFDTQKLNSQDVDAFVGVLADNVANHSQNNAQTDQAVFNGNTLSEKLAQLPTLIAHAKHTQITPVYCLPNDVANIEHQLANLSGDTKAVILIGFGAGNLPSSDGLTALLDKLHQSKIPVICTTMCAFGGTNADYAAGAWQYQHGVQASNVGIAGTYGRVLWQVLQPRTL